MGWKKETIFTENGEDWIRTEYGPYWYEEVCNWLMMIGILVLILASITIILPIVWLSDKLNNEHTVYFSSHRLKTNEQEKEIT